MRCRAFRKLIDMGGTVTIVCDIEDEDHVNSPETALHHDQFQLIYWKDDGAFVMANVIPLPMEGLLDERAS